MAVPGLYEDEDEQKRHLSAIQMLAKDAGSSEEEIRGLYEGVLQEFKDDASITTFLSILVSKKVKEFLHVRRYYVRFGQEEKESDFP